MAARRRASTRRASATSSGSERTGPKAGRDGKYEVTCPQCASVYKMPEQLLDEKFQCRHCGRTFFPKTTGSRKTQARAQQNQAKPFIIGGVGLVVLIVIGVAISSSGGGNANANQKRDVVKPVETGMANPRVAGVVSWIESIGRQDSMAFANYSDLAALQAKTGTWPDRPYAQLASNKYGQLAEAILAKFEEDDESRPLSKITVGAASTEKEFAEAGAGKVRGYWNTTSGKGYITARGDIFVDFRYEGGSVKVTGWTWAPRPLKGGKGAKRPRGKLVHEKIEAPEAKTKEYNGQKVEVFESPIIALEHLKEAPPAVRKEVDELIEAMLDLDAGGGVFNRSVDKLKKIGKPAMPRLLNKLHELHLDLDGNNLQISRVVRALRQLTGAAFAYPVMRGAFATESKTKEERLSSLRQWYAFWYRFANRDWQELIEREESLDVDDEPVDPKKNKK